MKSFIYERLMICLTLGHICRVITLPSKWFCDVELMHILWEFHFRQICSLQIFSFKGA